MALTSNGVTPGCFDRMSVAIAARCGAAKLLPVATMRPPPFEACREGHALAAIVRAEHANRNQLRRRCEAMDDPGTGRPMTNHVGAIRVVLNRGLVAREVDDHAADEAPSDGRVITLDARIDDCHESTRPVRPTDRPLAIDRTERNDALESGSMLVGERLAPGGQLRGHRRPAPPRVRPVASAWDASTASRSATKPTDDGSARRARATCSTSAQRPDSSSP